MAKEFDLVVIGAGPGGYVAAICAAQLGMKVGLVEKESTFGGTCLNVGCIPSKALLDSSEHWHLAKTGFAQHGIHAEPVFDLAVMMKRKKKIVAALTTGIKGLLKKNGVITFSGTGKIEAPGLVVVEGENPIRLETEKILLATGSVPVELPFMPFDEKQILSSTGALSLDHVPEHLVVVGGGVIGLELGSVWHRLGAKVTVIEFLDRILPGMDGELSVQAREIFKKEGFEFYLSSRVESMEKTDQGVQLGMNQAGELKTILCDAVLVCVGRKPFDSGLGLDYLGVKKNSRGFVEVDENFETTVQGIYAIGDLVPGPMLAHKAEEDGVICVERMNGLKPHHNYNLVPGVVYTHPEIASVGKTEEELKSQNISFKVGKFPFMANGRAKAMDETRGFVKVLADSASDEVLGVHMIGPRVSEMIASVTVLMEYRGSAADLARICFAHPTLSEVIKEASLAVDGRAIHI